MAGAPASSRRAPRSLACVGAGALLALGALVFGTAPLLVAAVGLAALGVIAEVLVSLAAIGVEVRRELAAHQAVEHAPLRALITLRCGPLGLPGARLWDPLCNSRLSVSVRPSMLHLRREVRIQVQAGFARRGSHLVAAPALSLADPLALASRRRAGGRADRVLVLPATEPVVIGTGGGSLRGLPGGGRYVEDPPAAVEPDGLRPYRPGTPATRIHWPALARGAGLLERRLRAETQSVPLVILDPRDDGRTELLDAAVRAAASLTLWLAGQGGCRLLLGGERRALHIEPNLRAWPAAHVRLALVCGGAQAPAPWLTDLRASGLVLYVAARPIARLPAALLAAGIARCALVVPEPLADGLDGPPAFTVAGCCGTLRATGAGRPSGRVHGAAGALA
jgi:uncharacterized protein (DUF58 family)